jgi:predicted AAA+ superfamily ATPase
MVPPIRSYLLEVDKRLINKDLPATNSFDDTTIRKIRSVLYAIANSSEVNVSALSRDQEIDRAVLTTVLDGLEKASVLQRVYPYAQHGSQTTKPSK